MDAFNLFFAASVLAAGSLSDRFGRKGMLLAGLAVFGLSSLAGGLMDSPGRLIAARAVMGVGAAMVFPATLSLLTNVFTERRERALAIGLWGAITGAAIALGPIVGGWLLEFFDWRSIFFAMTPIAAIAGVLVAGYVPTSRDPRAPRTDRAGFALSTATIGLLVYTIIEAPDHGWASARTLGGFALTAVLAAAFVAWERRTRAADARPEPVPQPALHRRQRDRSRSRSSRCPGSSSWSPSTSSSSRATARSRPACACCRSPSPSRSPRSSATRLAVRFGTKLVVAAGLSSMAAFYLWVTTTTATTSYVTIAAQMVVLGTGMGLTSAPATEAIMGVVPKAKAGVGSAVNDATRLLGGTLGVAVIGSVYASLYASRLTQRPPLAAAGHRRPRRARISRRRAHRRRRTLATPATRRSRRPSTTPPARPSSTASTPPTTSPPASPPPAP